MVPQARVGIAVLLAGSLSATGAAAAGAPDPAAALDQAMAAAESRLREGELQSAESEYRSASPRGLAPGRIPRRRGRAAARSEGGIPPSSTAAVETRRALQSLALVRVKMGEAREAVDILTPLATRYSADTALRRLLAQALASSGQPERAIQELEEARSAAPGDLELAFALATGYLKLKKPEAAQRLFAQVLEARPIPQTHVLLGRTYRDFGAYDFARAELKAALAQDPRVRRAHYYLGTLSVMSEGPAGLAEAIAEFRQELELDPRDTLSSLRLGFALMESRRPEEAVPPLERATRAQPPEADAFHYLGRAQLALDRPAEAAASLERALQLADRPAPDPVQLGSIHYNLAMALRRSGDAEKAAAHFAAAEQASARIAESGRDRLARYMRDSDPEAAGGLALPIDLPLAALAPAARLALQKRATTALARAYVNLGVMQAQKERFARGGAVRRGGDDRSRLSEDPILAGRRPLQRPGVRRGDGPQPRGRRGPARRRAEADAGHGVAQHRGAFDRAG